MKLERWETPDDDFLELARIEGSSPSSPTFVLLHGLEGSLESHYVSGTLNEARRRGWQSNLLLFRTCGSEVNRQPRSYHSGETADLDFAVARLLELRPKAPVVVVGFSLGGNVLLKWIAEHGDQLDPRVRAAVAVSVPFDLARCSRHIDTGFSRIYRRRFLKGLRNKALAKIARFPGLANATRVAAARTLWDFDDAFTSVVHGFTDAADYYRRCSSLAFLGRIRLPALLLSAHDDPFYPPGLLADVQRVAAENPALEIEFVERGGHVGFVEGPHPWRVTSYCERRPVEFAHRILTMSSSAMNG